SARACLKLVLGLRAGPALRPDPEESAPRGDFGIAWLSAVTCQPLSRAVAQSDFRTRDQRRIPRRWVAVGPV
ncbi:hypothetical protein ACFL5O_07980, partial [Myxococcota bacterium]